MKKNILILGGTGFLGSNVIDYYLNNSQLLTPDLDLFFIIVGKQSKTNFTNSICYDIDFTIDNELRQLFELYIIDEVFHFISTSVPANSNSNIITDVKNNLLSTINLLELMKEFNVNNIIYLSSGGTVYGEHIENNFQEETLSSPNNSYGVLKITIENYIKLYHKLFGINYLIFRISNPFGKHHKSELNGLINIAIRKSIHNEIIQIWGDGTSKKDYIFASDFASIFWKLKKMNNYNDTINIGSGQMLSINEILNHIKVILPETKWEHSDEKLYDTRNPKFNIDKLKSKINFENTEILEAIKESYLWELKNKK